MRVRRRHEVRRRDQVYQQPRRHPGASIAAGSTLDEACARIGPIAPVSTSMLAETEEHVKDISALETACAFVERDDARKWSEMPPLIEREAAK